MNPRDTAEAPTSDGPQAPRRRAFTLVELLTVIGIMGVLVLVALPAFQGLGRGSGVRTGAAVVKSTLALARQSAVTRSEYVYVVFATVSNITQTSTSDPVKKSTVAPYRSFAVLVVDNSTNAVSHFVSDWKTLSPGVFFKQTGAASGAVNVFQAGAISQPVNQTAGSAKIFSSPSAGLPMLVFSPTGALVGGPPRAALDKNLELRICEGILTGAKPTYTKDSGVSVLTYALTGTQEVEDY